MRLAHRDRRQLGELEPVGRDAHDSMGHAIGHEHQAGAIVDQLAEARGQRQSSTWLAVVIGPDDLADAALDDQQTMRVGDQRATVAADVGRALGLARRGRVHVVGRWVVGRWTRRRTMLDQRQRHAQSRQQQRAQEPTVLA